MAVTLRDIARKANVSVNTVSRALNDKPEVSNRPNERILTIARSWVTRATSSPEALPPSKAT